MYLKSNQSCIVFVGSTTQRSGVLFSSGGPGAVLPSLIPSVPCCWTPEISVFFSSAFLVWHFCDCNKDLPYRSRQIHLKSFLSPWISWPPNLLPSCNFFWLRSPKLPVPTFRELPAMTVEAMNGEASAVTDYIAVRVHTTLPGYLVLF